VPTGRSGEASNPDASTRVTDYDAPKPQGAP